MSRRQLIILVVLGALCVGLLLFKVTSARRNDETSSALASRPVRTPPRARDVNDNRWPGAVSASTAPTNSAAVNPVSNVSASTVSTSSTATTVLSAPSEVSQTVTRMPDDLERQVQERLAALRMRSEKSANQESDEPVDTAALVGSFTGASQIREIASFPSPNDKKLAETINETSQANQLLQQENAELRTEGEALKAKLRKLESEMELIRLREQNELTRANTVGAQHRQLEQQQIKLSIENKKREAELENARREAERLKSGFDRLKDRTEEEKRAVEQANKEALSKLTKELESQRSLVEQTRKELQSVTAAHDKLEKEAKAAQSDVGVTKKSQSETEARLKAQTEQSEQYRTELEKVNQTVAEMQKKAAELQKEVIDAKSNLMLAQAQLEAMTRATPSNTARTSTVPPVTQPRVTTTVPPRMVSAQPTPERGDFQYVQVIVPKANLRAGPGDENSVVMEVPQDSVLLVEEKRGEWYRIISPTGSRAWIRGDVVRIPSDSSAPEQARPAARSRTAAPRFDPLSAPKSRSAASQGGASGEEFDDEATRAYQKLRESLNKK